MYRSNKRKITLSLFLFVFIALSIAATKPTVHEGFKNLQILPKDISEEKLDKIMDGFNKSLGVNCDFCHAPEANNADHLDFASDDKEEKGFARYMLTMTQELNAKYFNFENSTRTDTIHVVTCLTCHHGQPRPGEDHKE